MKTYPIITPKGSLRKIGKIIAKPFQGMAFMLLAGLMASQTAWAGPIIIPGSTYAYVLLGGVTPFNLFTNTVDGVAETFTMGSAQITINELMLPSDHGYNVLIRLRSTGDIFPVAGESAYLNIGGFSDPVILASNLRLTSVITKFLTGPSLNVLASWDDIASVSQPSPWNGYYPGTGIVTTLADAGGKDVRGIDIVFNLIPEPASLALLGLGLFAMAGRRKKEESKPGKP